MNKKSLAILALCFANVIWGSTFVFVKESVTYVDTFVIASIRCLLAAILLGVYIAFKDKQAFASKIDIKNGAILGLILGLIYTSQAFALKFTSSSHSAFITVSSTILTPIVLMFFFKTKESLKGWIAILTAFLGIYLLTFNPSKASYNSLQLFGDGITFAAAIICAFQLIYSGRFVQKGNFLALIFYQFLFGGIFSLTGSIISIDSIWQFPGNSLYIILYLAIFGTLYCYFVTVWAQKYVSTIATAMIFSMEPIFAGTFAHFYHGDHLGTKELIGAILILIGILYYQLKDRIKLLF